MDDQYKEQQAIKATGEITHYKLETETEYEEISELVEDEQTHITAVEVLDAILECDGLTGVMDRMRILDAMSGMREVFDRARKEVRKNYYRYPWRHQPKRIPPKVAVCSSRHKGRKCKKRK